LAENTTGAWGLNPIKSDGLLSFVRQSGIKMEILQAIRKLWKSITIIGDTFSKFNAMKSIQNKPNSLGGIAMIWLFL
jgi:hypothetical protein